MVACVRAAWVNQGMTFVALVVSVRLEVIRNGGAKGHVACDCAVGFLALHGAMKRLGCDCANGLVTSRRKILHVVGIRYAAALFYLSAAAKSALLLSSWMTWAATSLWLGLHSLCLPIVDASPTWNSPLSAFYLLGSWTPLPS